MRPKIIYTLFLILFSVVVQAQNLKSQLFVDEGNRALESGNLAKADSLFDMALEIYPNIDAYFNKALARLDLKDNCGFCENMYMASFYGDLEADSLYRRYCLSRAKMLSSEYDSLVPFLFTKQYELIEKDRCGKRTKIDFYDQNDSLLTSLQIIDGNYFYSGLSYKARYPGGTEMLNKFVANNLVYPKEAEDKKIQGKVYASFVVDENGMVCDARIVSGVSPLLDQAALDVIKIIPKWYPATNKGKPVREIVTINVDFSL